MEIKTKYSIGDWVYWLDWDNRQVFHDFIICIDTKTAPKNRDVLSKAPPITSTWYTLSDKEAALQMHELFSSKRKVLENIDIFQTGNINWANRKDLYK